MTVKSYYLWETLSWAYKENNIFDEIWNPQPELSKVICVFWDSFLLDRDVIK